jgi:hypothetical protein
MPSGIDFPVADRAEGLIRPAVRMAGLAAILFVSYGLVAPLSPGRSEWRLPIAIAAAGGLTVRLNGPLTVAAACGIIGAWARRPDPPSLDRPQTWRTFDGSSCCGRDGAGRLGGPLRQ